MPSSETAQTCTGDSQTTSGSCAEGGRFSLTEGLAPRACTGQTRLRKPSVRCACFPEHLPRSVRRVRAQPLPAPSG